MSLREKWSFTFSVAQLARAAREKAQYHRKHERDWAKKYAHKRDADGYERWLRALNLKHGTTFTLDVDDVAYFEL